MDLNEILIFCRVAQAGSFTAAAKILSLPKSTVSRKVQDLESRLGVTLLRRTTRKLHLTEAGLQLFHGSRGPLHDLESVSELATAAQVEARGRVRLTAPTDVGNTVLARALPELFKLHPQITLDLVLTDRLVDLVGEGFDLALRFGVLRDSSFIARKVAATAMHIYGSPSYIRSAGPFRTPQDVESHMKLRFTLLSDDRAMTLRGPQRSMRLRTADALSVDSFLVIKELVIQGQGLALMPSFLCREEVLQGKLRVVLDSWYGPWSPLHLLYNKQRFMSPSVTAARDFLLARLPAFFPD